MLSTIGGICLIVIGLLLLYGVARAFTRLAANIKAGQAGTWLATAILFGAGGVGLIWWGISLL